MGGGGIIWFWKCTFMHLADAFIQSDLYSGYTFFKIIMCIPWELNPQPFALLPLVY